jgi:hypothetical protein
LNLPGIKGPRNPSYHSSLESTWNHCEEGPRNSSYHSSLESTWNHCEERPHKNSSYHSSIPGITAKKAPGIQAIMAFKPWNDCEKGPGIQAIIQALNLPGITANMAPQEFKLSFKP